MKSNLQIAAPVHEKDVINYTRCTVLQLLRGGTREDGRGAASCFLSKLTKQARLLARGEADS